jgi:transcriptional regulator with XRE-family HTH domain
MILREYLATSGRTLASFAKAIGVSRIAVHYWLAGERMPRMTNLRQIVQETDGAVTPNDFLPPATRDSAE